MSDPKCPNCGKSLLECQGFCRENMLREKIAETMEDDTSGKIEGNVLTPKQEADKIRSVLNKTRLRDRIAEIINNNCYSCDKRVSDIAVEIVTLLHSSGWKSPDDVKVLTDHKHIWGGALARCCAECGNIIDIEGNITHVHVDTVVEGWEGK